jgi:hypothetical protein
VLLDRAPKVPGWEFYPYRLSDSVGDDPKISDSRTEISTDGALACASRGRGNRIDLTYFLPQSASEKDARTFAFITSERLVGEELLDQWIGAIQVGDPAVKAGPKRVPLSRIKPTIDSVIDSVHSQLPAVPRYQLPLQTNTPKPDFTLFEMKVISRDGDYPGWSDQFTGVTPEPELFKATRSGNFYSVRFSRCGETFCYLKIDGSEGLDPAHFADRGDLEDAITAALTKQQVGCSFGGGTGHKYSYIELALVDVERSIPVLRDLLQRGNIHRRSWLLFHDCTLANEWVGIFDNTPAPPRESE